MPNKLFSPIFCGIIRHIDLVVGSGRQGYSGCQNAMMTETNILMFYVISKGHSSWDAGEWKIQWNHTLKNFFCWIMINEIISQFVELLILTYCGGFRDAVIQNCNFTFSHVLNTYWVIIESFFSNSKKIYMYINFNYRFG